MAHERSIETKASPDAVWKIWSDPSTWTQWNPDVLSISLDGPFATGTTGTMTTKAGGSHRIRVEAVKPGRSFRLETTPIPLTHFSFHRQVAPGAGGGSRISQRLTMRGPLAPLFSAMMGERIAASFRPILEGLARRAEGAPRG